MMLLGLAGDNDAINHYAAKQLVNEYGFSLYDMHWQVEVMLMAAYSLTNEDIANAENILLPGKRVTLQDVLVKLYSNWGQGFMGSDYRVKNAEHFIAAMAGKTNSIVFTHLDVGTKSWLQNKGGVIIDLGDCFPLIIAGD